MKEPPYIICHICVLQWDQNKVFRGKTSFRGKIYAFKAGKWNDSKERTNL